MKKFLICLLALLMPIAAIADERGWCGKNVSYSYVEATHTLTISGSGAMTDYSIVLGSNSPWYSYSSDIVNLIIEEGLTSIGNQAFSSCKNITAVTIPNSVTSIGEYSFAYCSSLNVVTIPNSVKSIGGDAFNECI